MLFISASLHARRHVEGEYSMLILLENDEIWQWRNRLYIAIRLCWRTYILYKYLRVVYRRVVYQRLIFITFNEQKI